MKDNGLSKRGGRREGAGRKRIGNVQVRIQLNPEQAVLIKELGGSLFMQALLEKIRSGELRLPPDLKGF